jgi:inosine-uridine nucleoside N-ribohydrolase
MAYPVLTCRGMRPLRRTFLFALLGAALFVTRGALDAGQDLVVYDNDWNIPGSYIAQDALMPLLTSPNVKVLALTSETGDCWRDEGTSNLLRYLEVVGRPDIPVYNGAVFPLANTRDRMLRWEQAYGYIYWKGAWNDPAKFPKSHPDDPYRVNPPLDRLPRIAPAGGNAAEFLVRVVHEHPHQVTIFTAGPFTDVALAVALDPDFAGLARRLVFFGGALGQLADGDADGFHSDFNIIFDPEAAHMVLAAHWAKIIAVADVANGFTLDKGLMQRIEAHPSPAGDYLAQNSTIGLPLWEEVAASIIADPTLVTKSVEMAMDVETDHGMSYGRTVVGPVNAQPRFGPATVTIIREIDGKRFIDQLVAAIQTDLRAGGR